MKKRYSYVIQDSESGNRIDSFEEANEAVVALREYESDDRKNGVFTPGFYEIRVVNNELET